MCAIFPSLHSIQWIPLGKTRFCNYRLFNGWWKNAMPTFEKNHFIRFADIDLTFCQIKKTAENTHANCYVVTRWEAASFSKFKAQSLVCLKIKPENWAVGQPDCLCTITRFTLRVNTGFATSHKPNSAYTWKESLNLSNPISHAFKYLA